MPHTPQAILFDLDGTLLDSLPGIQYSAQEALATIWPDRLLPDLRPFIGPPIGEILQRAVPGTTPAQIQQLVAAFRASYDSTGWLKTTLFPGSAELLAALCDSGIRCFVASNKPSPATVRILQGLGIHSRFSAILCRDSRDPAYASKAEIVGCLLREFGIAPESAWLVGDCHDDYEAAHCSGVRFILADYGYGSLRCAHLRVNGAYLGAPGDLLSLLQRTTNGSTR
jgi:phosphoglycolate phosphatase